LRNLSNSLLGGLLLALLLGQAIFLLNPDVPLSVRIALPLIGVLSLTYGLGATVIFWLLLKGVETARERAIGPAWFSFRVLTWLFMIDLLLGAALAWHNLFVYRHYLPPEAIRALALAATTLSASAATLLVIGLFHYSFGRRGAFLSYCLFTLVLFASLSLPLHFRSAAQDAPRPPPPMALQDDPVRRRVTLVGIESASLSYLLPAVAEGKLPNFARLIEGGASGPLRTLYPTESIAIWTSMATGKLPHQHGLYGFYRYRFPNAPALLTLLPRGPYFRGLERLGLLQRTHMTSAQRQSLAFWNILNRFGIKVGLVRWWGTYPAESVDGFIVSEMFHRQVRERFHPALPRTTSPPELFEQIRPLVVEPGELDSKLLARFVDRSVQLPVEWNWQFELQQRALADDATYHRIGRTLRGLYDPELYAIYFFGLDVVSHYFLRYDQPESFGDVSEAERRKFGQVVDAYYRYLDSILGEYLQARREDEVLVVLSAHGIEPLPVTRRVIEAFKGNTTLSGYHGAAPDGLIIYYGAGIAPGARIQQASVVDVTPTLLYLMGLPLGQDMRGGLLNQIFEKSLGPGRPVTYISSYENFVIEPGRSEEILELPFLLDLAVDERN
jgi:hypothetical protein